MIGVWSTHSRLLCFSVRQSVTSWLSQDFGGTPLEIADCDMKSFGLSQDDAGQGTTGYPNGKWRMAVDTLSVRDI